MPVFELSSLLNNGKIVIKCRDNPDADAIASAFAVYVFLTSGGGRAEIVYYGRFPITKPNLLEMIQKLDIPIEFTNDASLDSRCGEGVTLYDMGLIEHSLGSCSTLIWDLLRKEHFPFEKHPNASTALYYGLFTATKSLTEVYHPLDKDMRDFLKHDGQIIRQLHEMNLSVRDLSVSGMARANYKAGGGLRYSIFKAESASANALGFICDLALQSGDSDLCIVYNCLPGIAYFSIRSRAHEIMASDFAGFLAEGAGSGGGRADKASGFINEDLIKTERITMGDCIEARAREYFSSFDIINSTSHHLDISSMPRYRKKNIPVGCVLSTDIFESGAPVLLRTLEGDSEIVASDDIYIIVGILGEVYPIKAEKFNRNYKITGGALVTDYCYSPTVRNRASGEVKELSDLTRPCVALGEVAIYSRPIERNTKIFTSWNKEGYMLGKPGDYIAVRSDDINDIYIIREDIFDMTYEPYL